MIDKLLGALVVALMLTGSFAVAALSAGEPNGCCGNVYMPGVCVLNADPYLRCQSDSQPGFGEENDDCREASEYFPYCCNTEGWCGE